MGVAYDTYYKTADLFGKAYPALIKFFAKRKARGRVLDVGCGQGRNALALARLGFNVVGIDHSAVGMEQMLEVANKEGLKLQGHVADMFEYAGYRDHNHILFDNMFHFLKKDRQREMELLKRAIALMKHDAELVVCIQDSGRKVELLERALDSTGRMTSVANEAFTHVFRDKESGHEVLTKYRLIAARKDRKLDE